MNLSPQTQNQNLRKTTPQKKKFQVDKKKVIIAVIVLLIAVGAVVKFGFMRKKPSAETSQENKPAIDNLIDTYRDQLGDLKKKAEGNNPADLQNYAVAQYATGDAAGAVDTFEKQIAVDPNNLTAHNSLGNALRDVQKYDDAIKEYEKAIQLSPQTVTSYINLGNLYQYVLKQKDKALDAYQRGIKANPESADLNVLAGILKEEDSDKEAAKQFFLEALKIQPDNQAAKAGMERVK